MTGRSVTYFLVSACLLWASLAYGDPVLILCPSDTPALQFAAKDLEQTLERQGSRAEIVFQSRISSQQEQTRFVLGLVQDDLLLRRLREAGGKDPGKLAPEGYAIRLTRKNDLVTVWAIGADATGAMYAGLALAETIAQDGVTGIEEADCQPHIGKRGLKMNIPLDARTPSYADCGDAAQQNIAVMWDIEFWKAQLDHMARHRYNTVTLWTPHPFPSLVKVPEYPDVALDDVKIADINWREWFPKYAGGAGASSVNTEILENLKTVRKITIQEKIAFWRDVMQYAHDRGIEFHVITWNIFVWAADGKYGITNSVDNEVTIDYLRKSVRCLFETYPLLAGIGVTAGEHMKGLSPDEKEQWLWNTYGMGVMDAKKAFPGRAIRFIHRYWQSKIPEITKHFDGFDEDVEFNFSYKYAKARLYANTDPGFVDNILSKAPKGTKWWWNLRNDDIFYFRWGDADYVRDFINHLPPAEQTEGFHMGSDGYIWGREFVSTEPDSPRQLEIDKHWYNFMLWGRLGYDPTLSNGFFEKAMQQRFPGKPTQKLQEVLARASKIVPAVNREHWHDWDYQWAVEACSGRLRYHAITDECWKPGGAKAADEIQGHADFVLQALGQLRRSQGDKAWQRTLSDMEAMAHLGNYYAEKLRAADTKEDDTKQAIVHLKKALMHWKKYAEVGQTLYKSQLLSRAGLADWQQGYENAQKDISLLGGSLLPSVAVGAENLTIKESSFSKSLVVGKYILPAKEGWWNWGMAPIYDETGKLHIFNSSIPYKGEKGMGYWQSRSIINHYVADSVEGPYTLIGTPFSSDERTYHNPQISKVGDTYVLVFLWKQNVQGSFQSIGMATAKSLYGPWTENPLNPVIPASGKMQGNNIVHASNPTLVVTPEGKFRIYYKSMTDKYPVRKGFREISFAESDKIEGPYVNFESNPVISYMEQKIDIEDPYAFYYKGMYYMIVEDRQGVKSMLEGNPIPTDQIRKGGFRPGLIYTSEDGIDWGIPEVGYQTNEIYFGAKLARSERPHILWKDGKPECLFLACHDEDPTAGYFLRIENWEPKVDLETRETDIQRRKSQTATGRPKQSKYLETGGERNLEVLYKKASGQDLHLDLYYPKENRAEKCPVIVFTHGGGWAAGNRYKIANGAFAPVFQELVKAGFAVAPVSYRLAKKDRNVAIRDCVIDCKDAIRFLAQNSESLGIDPMRVYVMGDSAGGHIAQMLLLMSPESLPGDPTLAEASYRIVAGVSWYGPCDFEKTDLFNHDDRPDFNDRFGPRLLSSDSGSQDKLTRYREMSPINYLTPTSPPLLMIQGDKDTTIPVKHAYYMQEKAEALRASVEIMIIKNSGHNWRNVDADIEPSRDVINERTVQFFVDHL